MELNNFGYRYTLGVCAIEHRSDDMALLPSEELGTHLVRVFEDLGSCRPMWTCSEWERFGIAVGFKAM